MKNERSWEQIAEIIIKNNGRCVGIDGRYCGSGCPFEKHCFDYYIKIKMAKQFLSKSNSTLKTYNIEIISTHKKAIEV